MFKEEDDDEEEDLKKSTQSELLHWLTGGIGGDTGDTENRKNEKKTTISTTNYNTSSSKRICTEKQKELRSTFSEDTSFPPGALPISTLKERIKDTIKADTTVAANGCNVKKHSTHKIKDITKERGSISVPPPPVNTSTSKRSES